MTIGKLPLATLFLFALGVSTQVYAQTPSPVPTPIVVQVQTSPKDTLDNVLVVVQILTFLINAAALWGLFLYVRKTTDIATATKRSMQISNDMLTEMRAARNQEIAPYVIAYIDLPYGNDWVMYFVVKNTGKTVAKDIKLTFEPPLMTGFGDNVREFDVSLIKNGISSLAPGQEIRTPLDVLPNYKKDEMPTVYKVQVSYSGGLQSDKTISEQVIDLSMFNDLTVLQKKGEEDLIKAAEGLANANSNMQRNIATIADTLSSGIWLKNPEFLSSGIEQTPHLWKVYALSKLNEVKMLWKFNYAGRYERRGQTYFKSLQSRFATIELQLLIITSNKPPDVPDEITNALTEVATKLDALSEAHFNISRESYEAFNASGDEVISLVDEVVQKLNAVVDEGGESSGTPEMSR